VRRGERLPLTWRHRVGANPDQEGGNMFDQFSRSVHAVLLLATAAVSQATLTVNPSPTLAVGASAEVVYDDPAKPNATVEVHVEDGDGHDDTVTITTVPKWDDALFTAPGAQDVYRPITGP
jgi:hypothetical protein